jgi:uncharacterized membrane protein (Fun14 family)
MGSALKKILKWMLIIVGFLAGMFFVGVQLLQKYGYVNAVKLVIYLKWCGFQNDNSIKKFEFRQTPQSYVSTGHGVSID